MNLLTELRYWISRKLGGFATSHDVHLYEHEKAIADLCEADQRFFTKIRKLKKINFNKHKKVKFYFKTRGKR